MSFTLRERNDRFGSNFMNKMADFIFAKISNVNIYHSPDFKYKNSVFSQPFLINSVINISSIPNTIESYVGIRGANAKPVILLKQDLISYFRDNLKSQFLRIIYKRCFKKFKLPWKDNKNIICIHVRLDDVENLEDYDGRPVSNYINKLIEGDKFEEYDRNKMDKIGLDTQRTINPKKLKNLVNELVRRYPRKKIHIVTFFKNKKIPVFLEKLQKKFDLEIHSNDDPEKDLWLLMNSEILVLSKSTFSIVAGYYHLGNVVYYPVWGVITSLGIGTKYDKSGWIPYV